MPQVMGDNPVSFVLYYSDICCKYHRMGIENMGDWICKIMECPAIRWLQKHRKALALVVIVVFLPVIIDRLLTHGCYRVLFQVGLLRKASVMDEGEWFSFLGSYLGAIGTIVIGMIAYRQSQRLGKLQDQMNQMQKEITNFQIHPIISVKKTEIQIKNEPGMPLTAKKEIENYYFSIYGKQWSGSGIRYIVIRIPFEDKGIIPTVRYKIMNLTWEIVGQNYPITLSKDKCIQNTCDEVKIIIDEDDAIPDTADFFNNATLHRDYSSNKLYGYDKSKLTLEIQFINQKGYDQIYKIQYWIRSDNGLEIGSPFVESVEGVK